ncbi:RagB/SusD family nutrient uptake outer membrane protein [Chitinophaga lutea]
MKLIHTALIGASLLGAVSCKKFVETPLPANELVPELVFSDDKTATASVVGIYSQMNDFNYEWANILMSYLGGMQADETYYASTSATFDVFAKNQLLPNSQYVETFWEEIYSFIYQANSCIEGLEKTDKLTPALRDQLLGEAYFVRAFMHFYLVNMYGDVPLITTTDYRVNNVKPRDPAATVFAQVIADLQQAQSLMGDNYPGGGRRIRPNKAAATALLARAYLYTKQWPQAEQESDKVLKNSRYELLKNMNTVFLADSREAIWQLQPVNVAGGRNTWEGFLIVPFDPATAAPLFRLDTNNLIKKFEAGDQRLVNWTGKRTTPAGATIYWPMKYKVRTSASGTITEHSMVMRLAEQYLIRAEARIQQDKLTDGRSDLDSIRLRAGLPVLPNSLDKAALLLAVEKERKSELFIEWGHRWFDLKRTQRADAVLKPIKGATWQPTDTLYPIPSNARATNPNLSQNEGYK